FVAPMSSTNSASSIHCRRFTTSSCMSAMWAAGPPKPMTPSFVKSLATSASRPGRAASDAEPATGGDHILGGMRADEIVVRGATEGDLGQLDALPVARGAAADGLEGRLVAADADEGLDSIAVAVDGERVVSTATLLRETVHVDGIPLRAGQVELVATDSA